MAYPLLILEMVDPLLLINSGLRYALQSEEFLVLYTKLDREVFSVAYFDPGFVKANLLFGLLDRSRVEVLNWGEACH